MPPPTTTAADLLTQVRAERAIREAAEVRILLLALEWADRHVVAPAAPEPAPVSHLEERPVCGRAVEDVIAERERLGLPELAWDAGASFGTALGLSTAAGDRLLRDALTLSLRLPRIHARVLAGEVPVWRARRVAQACLGQPSDVVTYLDQQCASVAEKIGLTGLDKLIDAAMLTLHPEEREIAQLEALDARHVTLLEETINHTGVADLSIRGDWADVAGFYDTLTDLATILGRDGAPDAYESIDVRRSLAVGILADPAHAAALLAADTDAGPTPAPARRRSMRLVAHLTPGNVLGVDPVVWDATDRAHFVDAIGRWAGRSDTRIHLQPMLHCGGCPDCDHLTHTDLDRYTPTTMTRTLIETRDRTCQFPYCATVAGRCDLDHRIPYDAGGQTCPCNLTPLCRHHHRLKTHAAWTYTAIEPGVYLWRDRYGQTYLRTRDGTTDLTAARSLSSQVNESRSSPPSHRTSSWESPGSGRPSTTIAQNSLSS